MSTTASKTITRVALPQPRTDGPCQGRLERCDPSRDWKKLLGSIRWKKFLNLRSPMESYAAEA
jgi:hypothetical protein